MFFDELIEVLLKTQIVRAVGNAGLILKVGYMNGITKKAKWRYTIRVARSTKEALILKLASEEASLSQAGEQRNDYN